MRPATIGGAAGLAVGALVGAAARGPSLVPWPDRVRTAFPIVLGGLAACVVVAKVGALASIARMAKGERIAPSPAPLLIGAALAAGAAAAGYVGREVLLTRLAEASRGLDPGFAAGPQAPHVSGGPGSMVTVRELGREGARFVGTATTAQEVRVVTGQDPVAEPVRVFIGVEAADTVEQRVGLAMAELRRTGSFDRKSVV